MSAKKAGKRKRFHTRRLVRLALMVVVPLAAGIVALEIYLSGGRHVVTENAYVKADIVAVSADVSGRVVGVHVEDNQLVEPGQRLFSIDPVPFRIAVAEADAQTAVIRTDIAQLRFDVREAHAEAAEARERLRFLKQQFERQKKLKQRGMGSEEAYDQALHELKVEEESLRKIDQRIARSIAALGGDPDLPVEQHPRFRRAVAIRDQAAVDLQRTLITAPAHGVVSNMKLQVGEYVKEGSAIFSLIETSPVWVEANLKETELTNVSPGQPANVAVDAYPDHEWRAFVDTIAPATGAEFALLPPQNATGNWVKVVQRVPVSLRIERTEDEPILRAGMTVRVSIDTGKERELASLVPDAFAEWRLPEFVRRALALDRSSDRD